jgi:hypothetical protein
MLGDAGDPQSCDCDRLEKGTRDESEGECANVRENGEWRLAMRRCGDAEGRKMQYLAQPVGKAGYSVAVKRQLTVSRLADWQTGLRATIGL